MTAPWSGAEWVYPIYLVADTGAASLPAGWSEAITLAADAFVDEMVAQPQIGDEIGFAALLHASAVWTERSLAPVLSAGKFPLPGSFSTSYESLFRQLGQIVEYDAARIRQSGMRAYMPLVLLAVGQAPVSPDGWSQSWRHLVIDDEVQVGDAALPRALVVPVCVDPDAEPVCRELRYPPATARAYRAKNVSSLAQLLVTILVHAARHLAMLPDGSAGSLLPDDDVIAAFGSVIADSRAAMP